MAPSCCRSSGRSPSSSFSPSLSDAHPASTPWRLVARPDAYDGAREEGGVNMQEASGAEDPRTWSLPPLRISVGLIQWGRALVLLGCGLLAGVRLALAAGS